jgi:predicted lipoprotein with Yx(FWY)xxD motif
MEFKKIFKKNKRKYFLAIFFACTILALSALYFFDDYRNIFEEIINPKEKISPVKINDNPKLSRILTDVNDMTLYAYARDANSQSSCYGDCLKNWEPLIVNKQLANKESSKGYLGQVPREDGQKQITYNGMPLYRFKGDKKPGDAFGQSAQGLWFVVSFDQITSKSKK